MSVAQMFLGVLVLATSSVVFPQSNDTKPPGAGTSPASGSQLSTLPTPNPCAASSNALDQAEILTDTMGVDFGPYLARITEIVRTNWYNVLPPSVYPPILKQGKLSLEFFILKDGKAAGLQVRTSSGDIALDRAAWASITASSPFAALPTEFSGQRLGLRFYFFYNLDVIRISISPCADVRVPAGSTLQFSASGKGITDRSVTWRVSGPGCSKSACGTISDNGLYTAPVDIPNPPTVIVEATSRTDVGIPGKAKLTVVQVSPSH